VAQRILDGNASVERTVCSAEDNQVRPGLIAQGIEIAILFGNNNIEMIAERLVVSIFPQLLELASRQGMPHKKQHGSCRHCRHARLMEVYPRLSRLRYRADTPGSRSNFFSS